MYGYCNYGTIATRPKPCKTIAERLAAKNEGMMVAALEKMWNAFDERALNANEVTLFAYLLHEAERNLWQMPFRCKDYMLLTLLLKKRALDDARRELASRNLVIFDVGDGKRDVPQYTIVCVGNNAAVKNGKPVATRVGTHGEVSGKANMETQAKSNETSAGFQRTTSEDTSRDTTKDTSVGTNVTSAETPNVTTIEANNTVPKEVSYEVYRWPKVSESNVSPNPQANTFGKPGGKPYGTKNKPQPKDKLNLNGNR